MIPRSSRMTYMIIEDICRNDEDRTSSEDESDIELAAMAIATKAIMSLMKMAAVVLSIN